MTLSAPLKLLIVEDQPAIRKDILSMIVNETDFIVAGTCGSVKDARVLMPAIEPDLLLLDITLTDGTGFDILEQNDMHHCGVIFLTAHKEHAIKAIKFGALDYVLKPIDQAELIAALHKAKRSHAVQHTPLNGAQEVTTYTNDRQRIVLRFQDELQVVQLQEIVYCHSDAGYTTFFLADGRKLLTSKCLKEYEADLPESLFLRTHQSYVVNTCFIDRYRKENNELVLRNGAVIPVAGRRKEMLLHYMNHLR
jgi:two-component system LytT family response regulator